MANILRFGLLISIQRMAWAMKQCIQAKIMLMTNNSCSKPFSPFEPDKISKKMSSITSMMMG